MKNIFLVEDDHEVVELLTYNFNSTLYQLTICNSGKDALKRALTESYDVILLEALLPDIEGVEVCKTLRDNHINSPIMMLAARSDEADKVIAFEMGADDYVTRPFGVRELMARTKALLRRSEQSQTSFHYKKKEIQYRDIYIDKEKRLVCLKGKRLMLTNKEFDMLFLLAGNPGKTFSRQEMLEQVWGYTFEGYEHTVTSHINRLRIKIEDDLTQPQYILTTWGAGYRFQE
jgi:two-component system, OmpR family, alkaline phosphatase synthesis response regulator PhoP